MGPENEHYIMIQAWDEQTGGWFDVVEAENEGQAAEMVAAYRLLEENNNRYFSIVTFERKVLRPPE